MIITEFKNNNIDDSDEIEKRIKKIFKNRIYYFTKHINKDDDVNNNDDNNNDYNNK